MFRKNTWKCYTHTQDLWCKQYSPWADENHHFLIELKKRASHRPTEIEAKHKKCKSMNFNCFHVEATNKRSKRRRKKTPNQNWCFPSIAIPHVIAILLWIDMQVQAGWWRFNATTLPNNNSNNNNKHRRVDGRRRRCLCKEPHIEPRAAKAKR